MGSEPLGALNNHVEPVLDFLCRSQDTLDTLLYLTDELSKSTELIKWLQTEVKSKKYIVMV